MESKSFWATEVIVAALLGGGITWIILSSFGMPGPLLVICCLIGASVSFWADNFRKKNGKKGIRE